MNGQPIPKAEVPQLGALTLEDISVDILDEVVRAGFDREQCVRSLVDGTYDDSSATYFLLLYRKQRTSHSQQQKQAEIDGVHISAGSSIEHLKQAHSGTLLTSIHEGQESSHLELTPEEIKRGRRHSTKRNPKYPFDEKRARRHSAERPKRSITRVNQPSGHRRNNTVGSAVDIFEGAQSERTTSTPTSPSITSPSRSPRSPVMSPKVVSPPSSSPGSSTNALIVLPSKRRPSEGEEAINSSASESGTGVVTRTKRATSDSYNSKEGRAGDKSPSSAQQPLSPSKDKERKLSAPRRGHRRYRSSDSKDQVTALTTQNDSEKNLKEKEKSKKIKRLSDRIQSGSMAPSPVSSPSINVQRKLAKQTSTENVYGHSTNITISHKHKSPRDSDKKDKEKNRQSREIPLDVVMNINNNNTNNNTLATSGSIERSGSIGHPLVHSQSTPIKLTVEEADDDWVIMNPQNSDDFKSDHKE